MRGKNRNTKPHSPPVGWGVSWSAPCTRITAVHRDGFSFVELIAVVAIIAILSSAIVPYFQTTEVDQLQGVAQIVAADLSEGRNLAVTNNSSYSFTFTTTTNQYYLQHAGSSTVLNTLPPSPYGLASDTSSRRTTDLDELPIPGVKLHAVIARGTTSNRLTSITFASLGNTTESRPTEVWLKAGAGSHIKYLPIKINPVTGLNEIGELTGRAPADPSSS